MKQYKGYYIDGFNFKNEKEIDEFLKLQAIKAYRNSVTIFMMHPIMEASVYCDEKAEILVNQFGFTWEQVEELEIQIS